MGKVYVFVNQKGGVGKTTSAINIGAYMALAGKKVLLVDFDSQGNMSSGIGVKKDENTIYELLLGDSTADECIKHTEVKNLDAICADVDFAGFSMDIARFEAEKKLDEWTRNFLLKNAIEPLKKSYDYILIDCPPSLGIITLNGLAAADAVLVPMQCEYFALEGISLLLDTYEKVRESINPNLQIGGIFFTMYGKTTLAKDVVRLVKERYGDSVFNTMIPRNVRLSEAPSYGQAICDFDPNCVGAKSYKQLADEVMSRG